MGKTGKPVSYRAGGEGGGVLRVGTISAVKLIKSYTELRDGVKRK